MSDPIITMSLVNMLKRHEGKRLHAYKCPAGHWTIGYGHNLEAHPLTGGTLTRMGYSADVEPEDLIITETEAERLLQEDVECAWVDLESIFPELYTWGWPRRDALLDMIFWIGKTRFLGFHKMIDAVLFFNWNLAAVELMDSDMARNYPNRAAELAEMVRTDKYQGVV